MEGTLTTIVLVALTIAAPLYFVYRALAPMRAARKRNEHAKLHGTDAAAVIVGISQPGVEFNDQPECEIQLQVTAADGSSFASTTRQIVSLVQIPQFQPGAEVTVRYDPADPAYSVIMGLGSA